MTGTQWEHQPEVRDALRTIVADPELGIGALSNPQALSNLLKDLLPDAPRETSVLVAAAEAGLPQTLADHVAQGMDLATASSVTESAFAARTPFTPEACRWAVAELAVALGLAPGALAGAPATPRADSAETVPPRGAGPAPAGWYGPPPGAPRPGAAGPGAGRPYGGRPAGPGPAGARPVTVTRARRIPGWVYAAGGLVAVLVIAVIAAAAAHHDAGQGAVEPLSKIIKPDVKRCRAASALSMPGVTSSLACSTADLSIGLSAYQFGRAADYQAGLAHLNRITGWNPSVAGHSCPPPVGSSIGHERWHTLHNPSYQALRPGQFLECYTDPQSSGLFLYLWTLPSQRVILVAGDSAAGASYAALQVWWEKLTYG